MWLFYLSTLLSVPLRISSIWWRIWASSASFVCTRIRRIQKKKIILYETLFSLVLFHFQNEKTKKNSDEIWIPLTMVLDKDGEVFPVRVLQWYWYHAHTTSTWCNTHGREYQNQGCEFNKPRHALPRCRITGLCKHASSSNATQTNITEFRNGGWISGRGITVSSC